MVTVPITFDYLAGIDFAITSDNNSLPNLYYQMANPKFIPLFK